jgi:hypothetical protein
VVVPGGWEGVWVVVDLRGIGERSSAFATASNNDNDGLY